MRQLPPHGISSCQCEEVHIGSTSTARLLLYSEQGECVGEARIRGFSDATLDLLERLKESIELDYSEHLGGTTPSEEDAAAPFHFGSPTRGPGGRDFGPNS